MSEIISKLNMLKLRQNQAIINYINIRKQNLERLKASKLERIPLNMISTYKMNIDLKLKKAEGIMKSSYQEKKLKYMNLVSKIDAMSPLKTLTRGYSVAEDIKGKVICKKEDVKIGDELKLLVTNGKIITNVKEVL